MEHAQIPSDLLLMENPVLPAYPCQKPSLVENYASVFYHNFQEFSSMAFCLGCYGFEGLRWGKLLSQKPSMSPFLNCEPAVINTMSKIASLSFTVDHGLTYGVWCGAQTSTLSLMSVHAIDLSTISSGTTDHEHEHSPLLLHGEWVPAQSLAAAQA